MLLEIDDGLRGELLRTAKERHTTARVVGREAIEFYLAELKRRRKRQLKKIALEAKRVQRLAEIGRKHGFKAGRRK